MKRGVVMGKIVGAYILPHPPVMIEEIGRKDALKVSNTVKALEEVSTKIAEQKPDTIIIITPHGPLFRDGMTFWMEDRLIGSFKEFGAPNLKYEFENDVKFAEKIMEESEKEGVYCIPFSKDMAKTYRVGFGLDHGALVPLHFINMHNEKFKLVHITYSGLPKEDHYKLGMAIAKSIEFLDRNAVIIASGDLSHRLILGAPAGYSERGKEYDNLYMDIINKGNIQDLLSMEEELIYAAGECAYKSTVVLMGCFAECTVKGDILSYEGPFGVGYCVAELKWENCGNRNNFLEKYMDNKNQYLKTVRKKEDPYVKLARTTLENRVRYGKKTEIPKDLPKEMTEKRAGVFVSLKKNGELRGCIGTIGPTTKNIAHEIMQNAISAGLKDPRFFPLEEDELDDLIYSVDVLGEPETIKSLDELDPKRYGVIVRKGMGTGLLLPNLEGVDTVEEQISIALRKAGIRQNEDYQIERFEVIRHN